MMINGAYRENISCRLCRHRHPDSMSCEDAKRYADTAAAERRAKLEQEAARIKALVEEHVGLESCPFCGGDAKIVRHPGSYGYTEPSVWVQCSQQEWVRTPAQNETRWEQGKGHIGVQDEALRKAREVWNRRPG